MTPVEIHQRSRSAYAAVVLGTLAGLLGCSPPRHEVAIGRQAEDDGSFCDPWGSNCSTEDLTDNAMRDGFEESLRVVSQVRDGDRLITTVEHDPRRFPAPPDRQSRDQWILGAKHAAFGEDHSRPGSAVIVNMTPPDGVEYSVAGPFDDTGRNMRNLFGESIPGPLSHAYHQDFLVYLFQALQLHTNPSTGLPVVVRNLVFAGSRWKVRLGVMVHCPFIEAAAGVIFHPTTGAPLQGFLWSGPVFKTGNPPPVRVYVNPRMTPLPAQFATLLQYRDAAKPLNPDGTFDQSIRDPRAWLEGDSCLDDDCPPPTLYPDYAAGDLIVPEGDSELVSLLHESSRTFEQSPPAGSAASSRTLFDERGNVVVTDEVTPGANCRREESLDGRVYVFNGVGTPQHTCGTSTSTAQCFSAGYGPNSFHYGPTGSCLTARGCYRLPLDARWDGDVSDALKNALVDTDEVICYARRENIRQAYWPLFPNGKWVRARLTRWCAAQSPWTRETVYDANGVCGQLPL